MQYIVEFKSFFGIGLLLLYIFFLTDILQESYIDYTWGVEHPDRFK